MPRENLHEPQDESGSEDDEEKRTLFCANLDERVTDDILYEVFLQAGPIESARIPKDYNGRQRTFGFITYVHKSTLPYALQLFQGLSLYRKTLTIKYQGSSKPSPMGNTPPGCSTKRSSHDSSSLRSDTNISFPESPPQNPFRNSCSPDWVTNSIKRQENISKDMHQRRQHNKFSPYQRKCEDKNRDHNRRRHYNNGSDRHSDQRSNSNIRR